MRKKTSLMGLTILLYLAAINPFISCQKNTNPKDLVVQNDKASAFFKTSKPINEKTEALIKKLKAHNDKTNFLNELPVDIGLPIWDKVYFNERKKSTTARNSTSETEAEAVSVPMTENNHELSGVIVMKIIEDSVVTIMPYTNNYLYEITYFGLPSDSENAKKAIGVFLFMDYYAFGTTMFRNIPKDIFLQQSSTVDSKHTTEIELNTSNFIDGQPSRISSSVCWEISWQVVNCGTPKSEKCQPNCDRCAGYCAPRTVGIEICAGGGSPADNGGGPSGVIFPPPPSGGGGGGGWSPPPPPPPCNSIWYRTINPVNPNPCYNNINSPDYNPFSDPYNPVDSPEEPVINLGITVTDTVPPLTPLANPRIIAKAPCRGNIEDMQSGSSADPIGILPKLLPKTNAELFVEMRSLMTWYSFFNSDLESIGNRMIDKFSTSSGGFYSSDTLNKYVSLSAQFKNMMQQLGDRLNKELRSANGNINSVADFEIQRPVFNGNYNKTHGLTILINDTECTDIKLKGFTLRNGTNWSADVEITITDHFGLDKHDALEYQYWHKGFAAWWILQHRRGFQPFKTKIVITKRINGQY
jgi:hypothetical protein